MDKALVDLSVIIVVYNYITIIIIVAVVYISIYIYVYIRSKVLASIIWSGIVSLLGRFLPLTYSYSV